ncbi:MAG: hypothetical protein WC343_10445 [Bacilli bacterium]|jgi:hypothetical protein
MQITYTPPGPYDVLMPSDLRKIERALPSTPREVQVKSLMWMVEHELGDPDYYGPRIRELSDRMGV